MGIPVSEERLYETGNFIFSPEDPVVPLAQDIRLKRQKGLQGTVVVVSVGKETGVKRSMDILPKKDLQAL